MVDAITFVGIYEGNRIIPGVFLGETEFRPSTVEVASFWF